MADDEPSCGTAEPAPKPKVQRGDPSVCSKCKTAKSIAIFRSLGICAECHVSAVRLRLHFAVMRMRPRPTEPILVAFSGGPGSTALLSLVDSYTNQDVRRTRKFGRILACHIDETAVLPLEDFGLLPDELISSISEAAKINERVDFVVEKLESVFDGDLGELSLKGLSLGSDSEFVEPTGASHSDPRSRLQAWFKALDGRPSSQEDLLGHFRNVLLARIARRHGCSVVAFGDTMGRIAIRTLSLTIKGRGEQMPLEIAGEAHIAPGLTFIRPLREVLPDEIAMYNRVKELRVLQVPSIVSAEQPNASIDRLTENLLVGLQRSFPATMGAVSKTAYKVQTRTTDGLVGPFQNQPEPTEELAFFKCAICYSYIHPDDADWRRRRTVESLDDLNRDVDPHKEDKLLAGIEETGELFRHLCYGCQNVARDLVDRKGPLPAEGADNGRLDFPPYGVKAIASNREKMKVMIGEFLIEDDEEDGA